VNGKDKFGKKVYERAKTEEIASMIKAAMTPEQDIHSTRNLSVKPSYYINNRKSIPLTPVHKTSNEREESYLNKRKNEISISLGKQLQHDLKKKIERKTNELSVETFTNVCDKLSNNTSKSIGVKLSNKKRTSLLNTINKNRPTPKNKQSDNVEYVEERLKQIKEELYNSLVKLMDEKIDLAINSLKESIKAIRKPFTKLSKAVSVKNSSMNSSNKKDTKKVTKSQKALVNIGRKNKMSTIQSLRLSHGSRNMNIAKSNINLLNKSTARTPISFVEILHSTNNFDTYNTVSDTSRNKSKFTTQNISSQRRQVLKTFDSYKENCVITCGSPKLNVEEVHNFSKAGSCVTERNIEKSNAPKLTMTRVLNEYEIA